MVSARESGAREAMPLRVDNLIILSLRLAVLQEQCSTLSKAKWISASRTSRIVAATWQQHMKTPDARGHKRPVCWFSPWNSARGEARQEEEEKQTHEDPETRSPKPKTPNPAYLSLCAGYQEPSGTFVVTPVGRNFSPVYTRPLLRGHMHVMY